MLNYQVVDGEITFRWDDDETISGYRTHSLHTPKWIEDPALKAIAEAIKLLCIPGAQTSYRSHFRSGKHIFDHVVKLRLRFPPADDGWNNFIVTHYAIHLTDITNKPETRFAQWTNLANLYKALRRVGFIPINTSFQMHQPKA